MLTRAGQTIATAVLLVSLSLAQEQPAPVFHSQSDLVTVPFQVRRGSGTVSDLKPADVVLLEDGVPRGFTIFEAPPVHLTLDLVVMFDVTNPSVTPPGKDLRGRAGFWDTKALGDLAGYWSESITRRLLDRHLDKQQAVIRFSIYRLDQTRLQRLCLSTSDPAVLADALHRLAGSGPEDLDIPMPAGLTIRNMERKAQASGYIPQPWSLAGAVAALKDSAGAVLPVEEKADSGRTKAARALIIFSTGAEGSSVTPEDLAVQAIDAGVPIYPVALPGFAWVMPYEGYTYRSATRTGFYYFYNSKYEDGGGNRLSMIGPGGVYLGKGGRLPYFASYYNYPFESLGDLTGGLRFDAMNHSVIPDPDTPGLALFLSPDGYSMTGGETQDVLERVKKHALARFHSSYTVGFVPSPSGAPREHKLEVRLSPKSSGKVTEGTRSATY